MAPTIASDPELSTIDQRPADVIHAARGDGVAFERLYRGHVDRVYTLVARMCGDRDRAETLTQDVFVRAWQKLDQYRGESAFSTWLHRLAVNVVMNDARGERRRRWRFDDADGKPEGMDAYHASPRSAAGERVDLERSIAALPPGARTVFVLHDVEGYAHQEIADVLGVTTGTTKAQLHRARMLLREALSR